MCDIPYMLKLIDSKNLFNYIEYCVFIAL